MHHQRLPDWPRKPELSSLLDLSNPPKELFYKGTWSKDVFTRCVAVIGSRRMTDYGRRVVEKIVPRLVFEKKTIISGFMYGVDQYAHRVCIENGGKTVAVLGWGINRQLDGADKKLDRDIISSGGLILSEWESQPATLWTFPVRNRIVAALSAEVIVVEAAIKSGSLITAAIARKLKRKVWAVPGEITNRMSAGTNMLIAHGEAVMWLGDTIIAPATKDPMLNLLQNSALSASEIARLLGKPVSDVGAQLSFLSLTGQIVERGGKYHVS
jgi:DNA processing protein